MFSKQKLLNVGITNASEKEILEYIVKSVEKPQEKYYIVTPNPEFLVYANQHQNFKTILNNARLAIPDGIGVLWAGKILGKPFKEKVTGVDLVKNLCKLIFEKPITVGFLGGRDGIAEKTAECLLREYPTLKVVFTASEWPSHQGAEVANENFRGCERAKVLSIHKHIPASQTSKNFVSSPRQRISENQFSNQCESSIDVLFVAFGFPKQEEWIAENLPKIPVRVAIGVGGAFDYLSGRVQRAPVWIQNLGFEWLYRLVRQPWRIKRQFALLEFIRLVIKEKLSAF